MKKSHPKTILYSLAALMGFASLCSFCFLIPKIYTYFSLTHEFPMTVDQIEILELSDNYFVPKATFHYLGEKKVEILDTLSDSNPYLLEDTMRTWSQNVTGYSANMAQCTLQKSFPFKQSIYTAILLCLGLYFYFLGRRAKL